MNPEGLGYPQVILVVWGPLCVVGLWHLHRVLGARLGPRERFGVGVIRLPDPDGGDRRALPARQQPA